MRSVPLHLLSSTRSLMKICKLICQQKLFFSPKASGRIQFRECEMLPWINVTCAIKVRTNDKSRKNFFLPPKFGRNLMSYASSILEIVCVTFSRRIAAIALCSLLMEKKIWKVFLSASNYFNYIVKGVLYAFMLNGLILIPENHLVLSQSF